MRRILPIGLAIYFLCFTVLAVLLRGAAPGPAAQTVQGVRLGSWDGAAGTAYFSGKRLDCARDNADSPYGETCRIAIAGDELVLAARARQAGEIMAARGVCSATYRNEEWPCSLQTHHNYPAATVAYVEGGPALDPDDLAAVRRRFPIENLPESAFIYGAMALWPLTTAALVAPLAVLWPRGRAHPLLTGAAFTAWGLVALLGTLCALGLLIRGFWD